MANILHVERTDNKITLGTTGTTINIASHTASQSLALDASKNLVSVDLGVVYQPLDASLTSIAGLTYVSDSFIKVTAEDTYVIRTLAETKTDLSLNLVENTAHSTDAHTMTLDGRDVSVDGSKLDGIEALADVTSTHETSHATVLVDGDFASAGLMYTDGAGAYSIKAIGTDVQAYHANLASLVGLSYVAASFVKMTGANAFALRTIGETADDLEGTIDHNSLANYDANKHIDHTGVTLTAGVGLVGGGTIAANRTFDLSVNELTEVDPPTLAHTYIPIYDSVLTAHRKVLGTNFGFFVDRGAVAAPDWDETTLTEDGTWRDLDCSPVVPADAKAILFRVIIQDNAVGSLFKLRKNGDATEWNTTGVRTQVANETIDESSAVVACDTGRVVEYNATNTTWTSIDISIRGWWF